MSRFVRDSKFRNIVVTAYPPEESYCELGTASIQAHGSLVASSGKQIAYVSGRGRDVAVIPADKLGKGLEPHLLSGHGGDVVHLDYSPFLGGPLLSCSDDCTANVWDTNNNQLVASFKHDAKVVVGSWNPVCSNVAATASGTTVQLWDAQSPDAPLRTIQLGDENAAVHDACWDQAQGSMFAATAKDNGLRFCDLRTSSVVHHVEAAHAGRSVSKVASGTGGTIFYTTGSSRTRDRELCGWDTRNLSSCLFRQRVDSGSSGVLTPIFDMDTKMLFLFSRGDTNIRVYEAAAQSPFMYGINNFVVSTKAPMSFNLQPKTFNDTMGNEVVRILQLCDGAVHNVRVEVPRREKGREFQGDLFPPTASPQPALVDAQEWVAEKSGDQHVVSRIPFLEAQKLAHPESAVDNEKTNANNDVSVSSEQAEDQVDDNAEKEFLDKQAERSRVTSAKFSNYFGYVAKFKYAKGELAKRDNTFFNLWPELPALETPSFASSAKYFAVPWKNAIGSIYVSQMQTVGKLLHPENVPLLRGHSSAVLSLAFNPYNPCMLASGGDDCKIYLWELPASEADVDAADPRCLDGAVNSSRSLSGHRQPVRLLKFHPTCADVLMSASSDCTIRLWDVKTGEEKMVIGDGVFTEVLLNAEFNYDGSLIAAASRDGKTYVLDPRENGADVVVTSFESHHPTKGHRVVWLGESGLLLTSGFKKNGKREIKVWDYGASVETPLHSFDYDASSSILTPHFVEENGVVVLTGKGEGTVRIAELEGLGRAPAVGGANGKLNMGKIHPCDDLLMKCEAPHSYTFLPRSCCNTEKAEWAHMLMLVSQAVIPVSFTIPRAKDIQSYFADDIYTPTRDYSRSLLTGEEWFDDQANVSPALATPNAGGKPLLSTRDPEEAKQVTSKGALQTLKFKQQQEEERKRQEEQDEAFRRMQTLAVNHDRYNPNLSKGRKSNGVDQLPDSDNDDVDDDEWDD